MRILFLERRALMHVKDETVYTNLSEAGLNMEDQADDDDNSTEYNRRSQQITLQ